VESGFPSETATNAKMLEWFLFLLSVKPIWRQPLEQLYKPAKRPIFPTRTAPPPRHINLQGDGIDA
jgi:hypothetical protein